MHEKKKKKKHEKIACGVAGGRQGDAGAARSPVLQGRSEVRGSGRESYRGREGKNGGKKRREGKKKRGGGGEGRVGGVQTSWPFSKIKFLTFGIVPR
jgi:hypothetical protein